MMRHLQSGQTIDVRTLRHHVNISAVHYCCFEDTRGKIYFVRFQNDHGEKEVRDAVALAHEACEANIKHKRVLEDDEVVRLNPQSYIIFVIEPEGE